MAWLRTVGCGRFCFYVFRTCRAEQTLKCKMYGRVSEYMWRVTIKAKGGSFSLGTPLGAPLGGGGRRGGGYLSTIAH